MSHFEVFLQFFTCFYVAVYAASQSFLLCLGYGSMHVAVRLILMCFYAAIYVSCQKHATMSWRRHHACRSSAVFLCRSQCRDRVCQDFCYYVMDDFKMRHSLHMRHKKHVKLHVCRVIYKSLEYMNKISSLLPQVLDVSICPLLIIYVKLPN